MKINVYALRDRVGESFRSLTMNESDALEKRNLAFAVNNDTQFRFMAKDMELYQIAEIDNKSGELFPIIPARLVVRCDELIGAERNVDNEIR